MMPKKRLIGICLLFTMVFLACNLPSATIAPPVEVTTGPTITAPPAVTNTTSPGFFNHTPDGRRAMGI